MTVIEYRAALDAMDDRAFASFRSRFGGSMLTREQYVTDFVDNPDQERKLCYLLRIPTEAEKIANASLESAKAATASAESARWANLWAAVAIPISLVALAMAWYASRDG